MNNNKFNDISKEYAENVKKEIKKTSEGIITRIRLSIVLKLNTMYTLRLIGMLIFLNIAISIIYGYAVYKTNKSKVIESVSYIYQIQKQQKDLPTGIIEGVGHTEAINYYFYDENNNLMYTNNSETAELINTVFKIDNENSLKTNENPFNSKEALNKKINTLLNINYVYEKRLTTESGDIKVVAQYGFSNELNELKIILSILVLVEVVLILLSLSKATKGTKKILKPIDEMNNTVKNITINELNTRLNISGTQNELKDLSITVNDMLDRIQKSYEVQNQFVSDASHELRTPIAVIQGYVKLLDRWGKEDQKVLQESIDAIKSEAENMKKLVENLLFLARGDKNTQEINFEIFTLENLMEEILKDTQLIDSNHNIILERNDSVEIYGDRKLIKQMLRIFIDNSIKYTPIDGTIKLNSYLEKKEVLIVIEDNGIGISEEDLPKIFNRFYRADESRTRETGGTGLGLSIARWIVKSHKGQISVKSALDKGTKIIISLPLNKDE
ncbi:sensor histidine kinase [Clostridium paridis]|uniref:histidine kinase n=1 Tax=Clostridium paridis TaxID=2803863 RepID=A0A937FEA6_9CLOT|nr:HAMP domain-containing sensor histidine kinase [Clostridium paridis]MBL4931285.1 HAMP domain-containing histidine kinase [Clostridium paridis]